MVADRRLFVKITRESLPRISDKFPFLYLERGRLEVDASSVKWLDADGNVIPLPVATINTLLLGPGTSVTHEAVKAASAANCSISWVGEDSLLFYAAGFVPTSSSSNLLKQMKLAADPKKSITVARWLFARRFPDSDLGEKGVKELMGMEGNRVRNLYQELAEQYRVGWKGRKYTPGKFELSDVTNKIMTSMNAALYGITCSVIHSLGYSPHIGFIHSGSPLPFVYDVADLYKDHLVTELAFPLTKELAGQYDRAAVTAAFRERAIKTDLLGSMCTDIPAALGEKKRARRNR